MAAPVWPQVKAGCAMEGPQGIPSQDPDQQFTPGLTLETAPPVFLLLPSLAAGPCRDRTVPVRLQKVTLLFWVVGRRVRHAASREEARFPAPSGLGPSKSTAPAQCHMLLLMTTKTIRHPGASPPVGHPFGSGPAQPPDELLGGDRAHGSPQQQTGSSSHRGAVLVRRCGGQAVLG